MTSKPAWFVSGSRADDAAVRHVLEEKRVEKLKRSTAIRKANKHRLQAESDARAVGRAVRAMVREQERSFRTRVVAVVQPLAGRNRKNRDRQFEAMLGLTSFKASETGSDGMSSFHFKFRSRGFGERRQNRSHVFRAGETAKAAQYVIREQAREIAGRGLVSNVSHDPEEIAGFFGALETFERNDRKNAQVYMSVVISLPHELSHDEREAVLEEICAILARHDLAFVAALHKPDVEGDPRNFHAHVIFSLRPVEIEGNGVYGFSAEKHSDLNDATFITPFRAEVAEIFNRAMARAGHSRRFTPLTNAERGMQQISKAEGKALIGGKAVERKQRDLDLMSRERSLRTSFGEALNAVRNEVEALAARPSRDYQAELDAHRRALEQKRLEAERKAEEKRRRDKLVRDAVAERAREAAERSHAGLASSNETGLRAQPLAPSPVASAGSTGTPIAVGMDDRLAPTASLPVPTPVEPKWQVPPDPIRAAKIASLVERLAAVRHLPLIPSAAVREDGWPRTFSLEPADRFDPLQPLFAEADPFDQDPQIQSLFSDRFGATLELLRRELTLGRMEPLVPDGRAISEHLHRPPEGFARAVFLAQDTVPFARMLEMVEAYWTHKANMAAQQPQTPVAAPARSIGSSPQSLVSDRDVLVDQFEKTRSDRENGR